MEKRNRKRITELTDELLEQRWKASEKEQDLLGLVNPYIKAVEQGSTEDIPKLIEIRQLLLSIHGSHIFQTIENTLSGRDTYVYRTSGWLDEEKADAVRRALNSYEYNKTRLSEAEDDLMRYVRNYVTRRDGYRNLNMLNELIRILPDCLARYNLMGSREYLLTKGGVK